MSGRLLGRLAVPFVLVLLVARALIGMVFVDDEEPGMRRPAASSELAGEPRRPVEGMPEAIARRPNLPPAVVGAADLAPGADTSGTAFSIDESGLWLTNRHVVEDCDEIYVAPSGRRPLTAQVAARHRQADLALIATRWAPQPLPLGPRALSRGHVGFGAGFPAGVASLVRAQMQGVARVSSAESRSMGLATVWLVTALEGTGFGPGASGSPIYDAKGRVLGVNFAGSARRMRSYAVPVDAAAEILDSPAPFADRPFPMAEPLSLGDYVAVGRALIDEGIVSLTYCLRH